MKRIIITLLLVVEVFVVQAQFAGENKVILRKEGNSQSTTIGTPDPDAQNCYKWTGPHIVGDPNQPVITVHPTAEWEEYTVRRITKNGVEEDRVSVYVEDTIEIRYVNPKYKCFAEGEQLHAYDFEIVTYPKGYGNLAEITPNTAQCQQHRNESRMPVQISISHNGHVSRSSCDITVINDGALAPNANVSVDIGKLVKLLRDGEKLKAMLAAAQKATDVAKVVPGDPCETESDASWGTEVGVSPKRICCDHVSYRGATISFGGYMATITTKCHIPGLGIPGAGSVDVVLSLGLSAGMGAAEATIYPGAMSCGSLCIPVSMGYSVGGGAGASALGNLLSADIQLVGSATTSATWCPWGSTKLTLTLQGKLELVGSVTLLTFIKKSVSFPLLSKEASITF